MRLFKFLLLCDGAENTRPQKIPHGQEDLYMVFFKKNLAKRKLIFEPT